MLTSALITLAQKEFPDWSDTLILQFLNEIQRMVFTQNTTDQMRIIDTSTGKDPILTTTSGIYSYDINTTNGFPYNAWRVCEVYSSDIDSPTDVFTYEATPATAYAKIIFSSDPGTGSFYVRGYRFPIVLGSASTQLEIPAGYHISHVYEGLAGLIETFRSGKSERWNVFQKTLMPEIIRGMSEGKRRNTNSPYRICGL